MADEIVASEYQPDDSRESWYWRADDLRGTLIICTPAGLVYTLSEQELRANRSFEQLIYDMANGLIALQAENKALRAREALSGRAEGQSAFDLQAQAEALKAARAADKSGFEAVIRELREEVAALKGRAMR